MINKMPKRYEFGICPVCGSENTDYVGDDDDHCRVEWDKIKFYNKLRKRLSK
jgi:hypothetical protein